MLPPSAILPSAFSFVFAGESDDMALAWEMLEMARLIYGDEAHGGRAANASKLADCHMYIADILCEQVRGTLLMFRSGSAA
jgi:ABC-type nitrate/sulfonate/bicarbonate transport system permease component